MSIPPDSPFVTALLESMQSEADADVLRQLRAGDGQAVALTITQRLVPLDAALDKRAGRTHASQKKRR